MDIGRNWGFLFKIIGLSTQNKCGLYLTFDSILCIIGKTVEMYSVLSSFKRVLWVTQDFPLINENNERISWYSFPSLYFKWLPLHLFNVSSQFSVFIFWHFRVSAQPLSGDWKNLSHFSKKFFLPNVGFFPLEFTLKHLQHQEHWTAKTITKTPTTNSWLLLVKIYLFVKTNKRNFSKNYDVSS